MHLMIADDIEANRKLLRAQLEQEGHSVIEAEDGAEVLDLLEQGHVDGVISDILMPSIDGYRLCMEIRKNEKLKTLPLILYTSTYNSPADRKLAQNAGADAFIVKPAPVQHIVDALLDASKKTKTSAKTEDSQLDETIILKQYNEALVRKLEEKNDELLSAIQQLEKSEQNLKLFIEQSPAAIAMFDQDMRYISVSQRWLSDYGLGNKQIIGLSHYEVFPEISEQWKQIHLRCLKGATVKCDEESFVREDGSVEWLRWEVQPWRDPGGEIGGIIIFSELITDRKEAEQKIREAEQYFKQLVNTSPSVIYTTDVKTKTCKYVSDVLQDMTGYQPDKMMNNKDFWYKRVHPDDAPQILPKVNQLIRDGGGIVEYRFKKKNGEYIWLSDNIRVITATDGTPSEIVGAWTDITSFRRLEEQLAQSQKMEAIGQLTGGIAHDFNNRLTVILGSLQLLEGNVPHDPNCAGLIKSALSAVNNAASLTRQLLTISRQQVLETTLIDINELIAEIQDMLQRTLGETIKVVFAPDQELWPVTTDRNLLENVLLNLTVNARDAMPGGGQLIIETHNKILDQAYTDYHVHVEPGEYAVLLVSDTGTGMSDETIQHAFEPFFTTKEKGKGTGLGLSMVYGFVKQSGGFISIYSEVGHGTTFRIYLPRDESTPRTVAVTEEAEIDVSKIKGKIVLLVEDDEDVRNTTVAMLSFMEIRIITADSGPVALEQFTLHPDIDLLFTDMVMPGGMSGIDLANRLREQLPDLRVLYTSGYSPQAATDRRTIQHPNDFWLGKPFKLDDLRKAIFRALTQ